MRVLPTAVLDLDEQEEFAAMRGLIAPGFEEEEREEARKAFGFLTRGEPITLEKANAAADVVLRACVSLEEQGSPDWWLRVMPDKPGGMFVDPQRFAKDMAALRTAQAREMRETLQRALQIVHALEARRFADAL